MSKRKKPVRIEDVVTSRDRRFDPLPWLMGAALVILVILVYRPAVDGQFVWDDDEYVVDNDAVRSPAGLADIWLRPTASPQYYPLVFTSFWVEWRLWEQNPRGYHETNVLLHAAASVLLWRVLRRLCVPGAYLVALVFALHPVMVESVAWITERKNTLSMVFYLAAAWAYLRFAGVVGERFRDDADHADGPKQGGWGWYAAALVFFVCALLSKTVTASLPAALLLILWWQRGRVTWRDVALLAPMFVLGALGGWLTSHLERAHVGAVGAEWNYAPWQRVLIAGRAVWFYAGKLLWPGGLSFAIYPKWPVDAGAVAQWAWPIAALLVVAALFALRRRIGVAPLVGVLIFGGTLVPALGFFDVYPMRYTFVADHYQYHAAAALIAVVVAGAVTVYRRSGVARRAPWAWVALSAAVLLPLAILTPLRAAVYQTRVALWTDAVAKNPRSWMAWTNLGHALRAARPPEPAKATAAYLEAAKLAPDVPEVRFRLGQMRLDERDYVGAEREFRLATQIEPKYATAFDMLGYALVALGRVDEGIAAHRRALAIAPEHWGAHYNLGSALARQQKFEEAATEFEASLASFPQNPMALRELANCRIKAGQYDRAADALRRFLQYRPDDADALFDLGASLQKLGRRDEAESVFGRAFMLKPALMERFKR